MLHEEQPTNVFPGHRSRSASATMKREDLERAYAEAIEEARVAAQIGQQLLEKNEENLRTISAISGERDNALNQLAQLRSDLEAMKSQLASSVNEQQKRAQEEIRAATTKMQLYKSQLNEAEQMNRKLVEDVTRLEREKLKVEGKDRDRERERARALQAQYEQSQARVLALEQTETDLRRVYAKTLAERDRLETELAATVSRERAEATARPVPAADASIVKKLQEELKAATAQAAEHDAIIRELTTLKGKLEEAVAGLALDHERAVSERADAMRVLDESRAQIATLRQAIEEERLRSAASGSGPLAPSSSNGMQSSLLGEIEQALENRIQKVSHHSSNPLIPSGDLLPDQEHIAPLSRKDLPADTQSSQEYFFLAAAAIKIALAIKHPEFDSEWIFRLQVPEAFNRAMRAHVPFHEWYPWLYNNFSNALKDRLRLKRSQQPSIPPSTNPLGAVVASSSSPSPPLVTPGPAALQNPVQKELELRSYASLHEQTQAAVETVKRAEPQGLFSLLKKIATEY